MLYCGNDGDELAKIAAKSGKDFKRLTTMKNPRMDKFHAPADPAVLAKKRARIEAQNKAKIKVAKEPKQESKAESKEVKTKQENKPKQAQKAH